MGDQIIDPERILPDRGKAAGTGAWSRRFHCGTEFSRGQVNAAVSIHRQSRRVSLDRQAQLGFVPEIRANAREPLW